jgi:rare lipoprotein A
MLKSLGLSGAALVVAAGFGLSVSGFAPVNRAEASPQQQEPEKKPAQTGEASYYGREFNGRPMANGAKFNPNSASAAHRSLPLGTKAKVTNLKNGRTTTVKVEDRGPYARGRVLDVSPRTADDLGMKETGHAPVKITPVEVPDHDVHASPSEKQAER